MSRISRREFAGTAAAAGACICGLGGCSTFTKTGSTAAIPSGAYTIENNQVRIALDRVAEFGQPGGAVKITDGRLPEPIIVARIAEASYAALSIRCPHRGVEVEYKPSAKKFRCASLGHSTFATDGTFLKGFANHPLRKFEAKLESGDPNCLVVAL